jgi:prolyl-tRNA synthetase
VTGINPGRDFPLEGNNVVVADIRNVVDGDPSPTGGGPLHVKAAIQVGRVARLGTTCSEAADATFLDKDGQRQPFVMGCYTINLDRVVAAAIEAHHDDNGIVWPMSIAPFHVLVLALDPRDEQVLQTAGQIHDELDAAGIEVLLDDRDERAGFKFKDADLIGIPLRIIVGKKSLADGKVELSQRRDGKKRPFAPSTAIEHVVELAGAELARLS